jgi:secreted PhoX family phosphatase
MGAGAVWMLSLQELSARSGYRGTRVIDGVSPYGPIGPKKDETTGLELLKLPDGFRYWSYSWTGDEMSDGVPCPNLHDGMAVVDDWRSSDSEPKVDPELGNDVNEFGDGDKRYDDDDYRRPRTGKVILVRNHEGGVGQTYLTGRPDITYAPGEMSTGNGGTTNLVFDTKRGKWLASWASLAGTVRNCAGGVTPWGSWLTCEETDAAGHGWVFDVGFRKGNTTPLIEMGRFSHEALMVDPRSGIVYETEDAGNSGLFKFVPYRSGQLDQGGRLYLLAIKDEPNLDLGKFWPMGTCWDARWVRIDDPTAATESCYAQGAAKGGARFSRLEGAWWGDRSGYFLSTNGGSAGEGQVFEYDPRDETLKVIYDAPNANSLDNPDNITVTPRGGLLLCEDAAGNQFTEGERLVGLTLHGQAFTFAMNNMNLTTNYNDAVAAGDYRQSEWAGACYSPDGRWLFVNIQTPGVTFAITGPWGHGPL